ncbi:MAG: hypothetical protein OXF41_07465 [bacterium]|nr:hypothetical protein [bacterium]
MGFPQRLTDIPGRLTVEEFWEMFGRIENEMLDFKRAVSKDIRETIPAMAMTVGGYIVHGVNRRLEIVGCPRSQKTVDRITKISYECAVDVQVRSVVVAGTEITITAVPEVCGRIVTTPDGRLLRRVGGDSMPLRGGSLARFVQERVGGPADEETVASIQASDLSLRLVNRVLNANGRPAVPPDGLVRSLADLGVARRSPAADGVMTAAVVLFAKEPTRFIPGASVQLVRRLGVGPGPGVSESREECSGPLPEVLDCCLEFIGRHTARYQAVVGTRREDMAEYPESVLREVVLNGLAHRDYRLAGATVDVTVWDDRIEVRSPGPLPGHITVENIREEHYSRNRRIMQVLKTLRLVEEYGEGVDRMFREMEARLMEPPIFVATSSSVTVTLRNRSLVDVTDQAWLAQLSAYPLSSAERLALVIAHREGAVTPRRLREALPDTNTSALLAGAVAKGLLLRVGERGGTRYQLSGEIVRRAGSGAAELHNRKRQMLLDEIRRRGSISTSEGVRLLGGNSVAVRNLLNQLVQAGLARADGRTRARRYYNP